MPFMHTLLPEPVAPAISRCGISARSAIIGFPYTSLPNATGILARLFFHSSLSSRSRMITLVFTALGTSTPTVLLPGTGARILIRSASSAAVMLLV